MVDVECFQSNDDGVIGMKQLFYVLILTLASLSGRAELGLTQVFNLNGTVALTHAGDSRIFATVQSGQIRIFDGNTLLATPFLNISGIVLSGGERGLLSTAFHPNYASNGFFYVNYTNGSGNTVIARYQVSAGDPNVADPNSAQILLTINQPFSNHNGGQLQFGPDGYLYVGMGDGGSGGDPDCRAQNPNELLGKILRLDVDQNVNTAPFHGIPVDNPFVGDPDVRDEIWALGVRNPWRFSFDRETGDLYIADVGQNAWEEIDFQPFDSPGGENYGWDVMEGDVCFENDPDCPADAPVCNSMDLTDPVQVYGHGLGCSVTGGYLYRGCQAPSLYGKYLYADICSGRMWALWQTSPGVWMNELLSISAGPTTFGEDVMGNLYVEDSGTIYRIEGGSFDDYLVMWGEAQGSCPAVSILDLIANLPIMETL